MRLHLRLTWRPCLAFSTSVALADVTYALGTKRSRHVQRTLVIVDKDEAMKPGMGLGKNIQPKVFS